MNDLKLQIKENYNNLTRRLKVVANFIVEDPKSIALLPAKEIGNLTNTSETTVIRCCHALGYAGYAALQEEIRRYLLRPEDDPLKALAEGIKEDAQDLEASMAQDIQFIKKTFDNIDAQQFHVAIEQIIQAEKIIVVGLRASYGPASWLAYSLNVVKGDTVLFKGEIDDANYFMTLIQEGWLIISFSFKRYSQQSIAFVKAAKEKGARILSITDDELSPIGLMSDLVFKVITPNPSTLKGMPVIFSILNAFISGVMINNSAAVENQLEKYQQSSDYYYSFYRQEE